MKYTGQKMKRALFIVSFLLLLSSPSFGIDASREELGNGLVVLHAEKHNLPIVMVTLLIKASPLDEPLDRAGLANLTAALLSEGTKRRTSEQISRELEFIACSVSASAGEDYTLLTMSVLKKEVEKGFDIFSDVLLNPSFPEDEIARQKQLIKGALKQREEDPAYVADKEFKQAVYGTNPYGRPVSGNTEGIDRITRNDVAGFYKKHYLPNNSILSVAGDLTKEELSSLMNRYLASWQKGETPSREKQRLKEPGSIQVITRDRELAQANIVLGHLGIERANPDYYAISVMNYILGGGGFSSRLVEIVRDEMGLAYDISSFFAPALEQGTFEVSVQTKNESANTVIAEIVRQMERITTAPVSPDELKDAISYLTGSFPRRIDTLSKLSNFLALTEFHKLGLDYDRTYMEFIREVTVQDVLRVAQKYLHPDKYILVVVADQKKAGIKK
ncbi:MAG: M16 family metallopeptidase [bacterium]